MPIPTWTELTDKDRKMLKNIALSFGYDLNQPHEIVDEEEFKFVMPNDKDATSIAVEMYTLAQIIIGRHLGETNA